MSGPGAESATAKVWPSSATGPLVGAVEAGGTKIVCGVGRTLADLQDPANRTAIPTTDRPGETMALVAAWFHEAQARLGEPIESFGLASFGPICCDPASPLFGRFLETPKPGWSGFDLLAPLRQAFAAVSLALDTDVNGAALGEARSAANADVASLLYVTLGTGIGVGFVTGGRVFHGAGPLEMGHLRIPRLAGDDFAGVCPFHGDCWEGLCSGPAMQARSGRPAQELPADHPAWDREIAYVAAAAANLTYCFAPQRILLGGSVALGGRLGQAAFFARTRRELSRLLGGYALTEATADLERYLAPATLDGLSGLYGALLLGGGC